MSVRHRAASVSMEWRIHPALRAHPPLAETLGSLEAPNAGLLLLCPGGLSAPQRTPGADQDSTFRMKSIASPLITIAVVKR